MTETKTDNTDSYTENTELRIIKKYPNRRLYDTAISSYITLEDVRRLVLEQVTIKVIDARTQADITHNTLLQIIFEQEENGPPLFTTELLQKMIRFYDNSLQDVFGKMFEQSMNFFSKQQGVWQKTIFYQNEPVENQADPMKIMSDFSKNNVYQWQQFQKMWLQNFQSWSNINETTVKEADK